jgi:hypothetical protein
MLTSGSAAMINVKLMSGQEILAGRNLQTWSNLEAIDVSETTQQLLTFAEFFL